MSQHLKPIMTMIIILLTLLILVGLLFPLSINSVSSKNDEFFVLQEDVYDDHADYDIKLLNLTIV